MAMRGSVYFSAIQSNGNFHVPNSVQATDVGLIAVNLATASAVTVTVTTTGSGTIATLKAATTQASQRYALFSIIGASPNDIFTVALGAATAASILATWWPSAGSVDVVGTVNARGSSSTVAVAPSVTTTHAGADVVRIFFESSSSGFPTLAGADDSDAGSARTQYGSGQPNLVVQGYNKAFAGASALTTATYAVASTSGAGLQVAIVPPPASLVAVADMANQPARVALQISGAASVSSVTISRVDAAGNQSPVRTANPGAVVGGSWIGYDYEAPLNEPVTYRAVTNLGDVYTSATVTVTGAQPWLIHPGFPDLSLPIDIAPLGDMTTNVNQGVHVVLGRKDPVVETDGVRQSPTFDLTVHTRTLDEEAALQALLADASVLLLQIVYPGVERSLYQWVGIGQYTVSNPQGWFGSTIRTWTLPCTVTSYPSGTLQAQWEWADIVAGYSTWNDVIATYDTWADVVTNSPAT